MAIHLTPTELAREAGLERREVIEKCMEMGVPIFQGRIDKTLFLANCQRAGHDEPTAGSHRRTVPPPDASPAPPERCADSDRRSSGSTEEEPMESSTAVTGHERSTGSKTIADLIGLAAERYGDRPRDPRTSATARGRTSRFARGRRDRVRDRPRADRPRHRARRPRRAPLRRRGPSGRYADFAITTTGAVVVPIYPTNSPEECEWVAGNSESRAIVCEDAVAGRRRSARSAGDLPALEHDHRRSSPTGDVGDAIALDDLRERGRGRDPPELAERARAVKPDDPYTFIYTSGTTGPPKGCVLTPRQLPRRRARCASADAVVQARRRRLPVPPARALLRAADPARRSSTSARRSPTSAATRSRSSPSCSEVKPTYLPSVPRIFEKIYTLVTAARRRRADQGRRPRSA